ncbi:hypothetical protein [Companilactobacillus kedongensis]|uniref:hypothetical protein n=1 Tax=Companilactobacillus kedongensis TaxID=2486004 RepID=UPI000F772C33|nr:hypothetical protein [Companilactobacillus kedongensis]
MKKSIKYAGVAAATLLAVAPVAAPVLTNTVTTVQADETSDTTASVKSAANNYLGNLKTNQTVDKLPALTGLIGTTTSFSDFKAVGGGPYTANTSNQDNNDATLVANNANVTLENVTYTIDGKEYTASNDDENTEILKLGTPSKVSFTVAISSYTPTDADAIDITTNSATTTYTLKDTATTENTSADVKASDSYDVAYGSSTLSPQLLASMPTSVTDKDGKAVSAVTPSADTNYYASKNAAISALNGSTTVTPAGVDEGIADDGTFSKENTTYYQVVTLTATADSDFAKLLTAYNADTADKYAVTFNGTALKTAVANNDVSTATAGTIKYVRAVNVGSKADTNWTTTDETGVVTTKNDKTYYTLKNDDNDTISNRALAANTSWQYDKVRTNAKGDKQYRVSTHEWVPAESVTVNDGNNNGGSETPEGALTVKNLDTKKVVNLATPGMTYFVYNKDGVMSTTRALAGGSSWLVDKTATDAAGNTYYGVSTDEFVKAGEGVSLAD